MDQPDMDVKSLVIDGTPIGARNFRYYLNGEERQLGFVLFGALVSLAVDVRYLDGDGCDLREFFGGNVCRYAYFLRHKTGLTITSLGNHRYRLEVPARAVFFNHDELKDFPDERVLSRLRGIIS